jgi:hypothetical protein
MSELGELKKVNIMQVGNPRIKELLSSLPILPKKHAVLAKADYLIRYETGTVYARYYQKIRNRTLLSCLLLYIFYLLRISIYK